MTATILVGDAREQMATIPAGTVQTCVTSPPYYGLRDYGHEGQIGMESTVEAYVSALVDVFREVRRVLKDDGTLWLNLGDSYAAARGGTHQPAETLAGGKNGYMPDGQRVNRGRGDAYNPTRDAHALGLKHKDLIGVPWRVAFALQADGWYLRQDIIWHKPNPMPESVTDRCTKAHEYLFLLSKSPRYHYNADAIAESSSVGYRGSEFHTGKTGDHQLGRSSTKPRQQRVRAEQIAQRAGLTDAHIDAIRSAGITDSGKALVTQDGTGRNSAEVMRLAEEAKQALGGYYREFLVPDHRNKRSVWTVPTKPYAGAHFAVFPRELITPCILAGSREGDTVLDPFAGSGTTGEVAVHRGRHAILCELNPEYVPLIEQRLAQRTIWDALNEGQVAS